MARIERASLRRVLAELDRRTCARSELFDPADDDTVRERFDALPMEEALRRLLGGRSFMIVHDTADTALGATEHAPMQRVVILPRSAAARAEPPGPAHAGPTLDDLAQAMVDPDERTRARAQALFEQALARGAEPSAADPPRPR